jgi:O-antigen ligase
VKSIGLSLRWVTLLALVLVAFVLAARRRVVELRGFVLAAGLLGLFLLSLFVASAAWSVDPKLTIERAVTFGAALGAAAALASAARERPALVRSLIVGAVAGVGVVTAVGFVLYPFYPQQSADQASIALEFRFKGLGENPNTVSMLAGLTIPLVLWALVEARARIARAAAAAVLVLSYATIVLSGSRGGLLAALVGALAFSVSRARRAALTTAAVSIVAFFAAIVLMQIPQPLGNPPPSATPPTPVAPKPKGPVLPPPPPAATPAISANRGLGPLEVETGTGNGRRTFFGSSGRVQAWRGAIDQANERPLLGYGFGTEDVVFLDHFSAFQGGRPENSFVGAYLQVGLVGLAAFVGLIGVIAAAAVRALRRLRGPARTVLGACFGVFAGGCALMLVQSYAYSAGNLTSVTLWTFALALLAASSWERVRP